MAKKLAPRAAGWLYALVAVLSLALYVNANSYADAADLREYVKAQVNDARVIPAGICTVEVAVDAVVSPAYLVFGTPIGRGTLYTRATSTDNHVQYWAIDYHVTRKNGTWELQDSGLYRHDPGLGPRTNAALSKERIMFLKG